MELTRRSFLVGSGIVGAGAAIAGLTGCTKPTAETPADSAAGDTAPGTPETSTGASAERAWDEAPDPIADNEIGETYDTEILVLGAGVSGMIAAYAASERGAKVMIMQNKETISTQGTGAGAFGSKRQTENFDDEFRSELVRLKCLYEGGLVNMDLLNLWLDRSAEAVDWVLDHVEPLGISASFDEYPNWREADDQAKTCPVSAMWGGSGGMGTTGLITVIEPELLANGVEFIFSCPVKQLVRESGNGRVVAAIGQKTDGTYVRVNASQGIIVCTGGYENNPQMRDKYLAHANAFRNLTDNTGDGILAGMWVGGDIDPAPHASNIHYNYLPSDPFGSGLPWLRVNSEGKRLGNEDIAYSFLPFYDVNSPEPVNFQIFDADYNEYFPKMVEHGTGIFRNVPTPEYIANAVTLETTEDTSTWTALDKTWQYYLEMGSMVKCDTLEELASELGINYEGLQATVDRYNELYDKGRDEDFYKMPSRMSAVRTPPFFGIRREACVLGTLNGLVINTKMQVLDKNREVIPGLYAAGNASGGRFFGGIAQAMAVPASTISRALVWGYIAANEICDGYL